MKMFFFCKVIFLTIRKIEGHPKRVRFVFFHTIPIKDPEMIWEVFVRGSIWENQGFEGP